MARQLVLGDVPLLEEGPHRVRAGRSLARRHERRERGHAGGVERREGAVHEVRRFREVGDVAALVEHVEGGDAAHAATALQAECALFVTNDTDFRRVDGLPVTILDDLLAD
ncbi:MAG: PIN domain-containing protein [Chloroflexi bacterium]|nr:PIN domain-containing protein [Chloroflexota bacterium]